MYSPPARWTARPHRQPPPASSPRSRSARCSSTACPPRPVRRSRSSSRTTAGSSPPFTPPACPVGPVLAITPYNAPLLLVAHKLASAFAAGNPCVVRPATKTPLSALSLGSILVEAGAPAGSVSVIPSPTALAERLAQDER